MNVKLLALHDEGDGLNPAQIADFSCKKKKRNDSFPGKKRGGYPSIIHPKIIYDIKRLLKTYNNKL